MRNVTSYDTLTPDQLREELVSVTAVLTAEYESLGMNLSDYHRDYLTDYAQSPAGSVTGKNREAAYANMEMGREILFQRARVNSLTLARDLLVFLLISREPGPVPMSAQMDDDGLPVV